MITGLGSDIVQVSRIEDSLRRYGSRFVEKVFVGEERACVDSTNAAERLAARFAAKEAFLKAIGTGLRNCSWQEMEVAKDALGKPTLRLYGRLAALTEGKSIHLSMSHTQESAFAVVVLEG